MLKRIFLGLSLIGFLAACNGDEIDDLENRMDGLERDLGTNSPIKLVYTLNDYNDTEFTETKSFPFKSSAGEYDYIYDLGDNYYEINFGRYLDAAGDNGIYGYFYYDATTNTASDGYLHPYFYDKNLNWINPYMYGYEDAINKFEVKVSKFDPATGAISFKIFVNSAAEYEDNEYGNEMTFDLSFSGQLPVYID